MRFFQENGKGPAKYVGNKNVNFCAKTLTWSEKQRAFGEK